MSAPTYRWICHKCGSANEPHTEVCASCGFAAVASAQEVAQSRPDYLRPPIKPPLGNVALIVGAAFTGGTVSGILGSILVAYIGDLKGMGEQGLSWVPLGFFVSFAVGCWLTLRWASR